MTAETDRRGLAEPVLCGESVLESVVVHSTGAVCTRRARCELPVGGPGGTPVPVWIEGLPVTVYEHSLGARVLSGPPGLRVTDVRVRRSGGLQRADELPRLRLDLEDAQDRCVELTASRDRLAAEIEEVAALRAVPPQPRRGDAPRWAPVESMLALAGFLDGRLALLHGLLRTAEDELCRAEHQADVLVHRVEKASSAVHTGRSREYATAILTLDGSGAGAETDAEIEIEIEIEVEYQVPGATWSPVYQLRLDATDSGAGGALVLRACVAQRTGEDWTGVRLGLSTADLLRRTDIPELQSLRIGRHQSVPVAPTGWREPPSGLQELFTGYDAAAAPVESPPPPPPRPRRPAAPLVGGAPSSARRAAGAGYGAAPFPPAAPALAAAPSGPPPMAAGAAPLMSPPPPPSPSGVPAAPPAGPTEDMLDYARLTLAGPDEPGTRGKLRPGGSEPGAVVAEHRRRAESVARLAPPSHTVPVRSSAGSFDYRFDTSAPVDVEADGTWHTVPVCEASVEMVPEYLCVPSEDQRVYGSIVLTNTSGHPLLAGPADVTVNGEFVLTAPLPTLAPGRRRRVGIGVVESVQVARRAHMRESAAGLRGGTTVLDHSVEVELANRLPHPVLVEVRERVPVTTDKDIRIEEHPSVPPWTAPEEPDDDRYPHGVRVWRVELEPGRTTTLRGGYEVRVPAGKALVGGNRRD